MAVVVVVVVVEETYILVDYRDASKLVAASSGGVVCR